MFDIQGIKEDSGHALNGLISDLPEQSHERIDGQLEDREQHQARLLPSSGQRSRRDERRSKAEIDAERQRLRDKVIEEIDVIVTEMHAGLPRHLAKSTGIAYVSRPIFSRLDANLPKFVSGNSSSPPKTLSKRAARLSRSALLANPRSLCPAHRHCKFRRGLRTLRPSAVG